MQIEKPNVETACKGKLASAESGQGLVEYSPENDADMKGSGPQGS